MGTLTQLMWLSRSTLAADQKAISVTSTNVSNQNTVGYTREVVSFSAQDAVKLGGTVGAAIGVDARAVSQRNRVLERRLQQQTQVASQSDARLSALSSAEQIFGLSESSANASTTAIGSSIDNCFASVTALGANPTDATTRASVLAAASTLASAFNGAARQLNDSSATLNAQIATAANQVNGLTAQIAKLNGEITSQSPDMDAGGLEDQRQQAIKELSAIIGVNQITGSNNDVTLTTTNGAVLVSGVNSFGVSTSTSVGSTAVIAGNPTVDITNGLSGGTIGGLLEARDKDLPAMSAQLDSIAYALGNALNAANSAGQTPAGVAGSNIFALPATSAGAALNVSVSLSSADGLATAAVGEGAGGTGNMPVLAGVASALLVGGETATGAFASFVGSIGTTVSAASADNTANEAALTQVQTQRDSLSGVSLDEEAAALTQYQRSYEAAAKVLSIVNTMFAAALNLGVQTSVS